MLLINYKNLQKRRKSSLKIRQEDKKTKTQLTEYDRKILSKYTKPYSNFIESNTAKKEIEDSEGMKQ